MKPTLKYFLFRINRLAFIALGLFLINSSVFADNLSVCLKSGRSMAMCQSIAQSLLAADLSTCNQYYQSVGSSKVCKTEADYSNMLLAQQATCKSLGTTCDTPLQYTAVCSAALPRYNAYCAAYGVALNAYNSTMNGVPSCSPSASAASDCKQTVYYSPTGQNIGACVTPITCKNGSANMATTKPVMCIRDHVNYPLPSHIAYITNAPNCSCVNLTPNSAEANCIKDTLMVKPSAPVNNPPPSCTRTQC